MANDGLFLNEIERKVRDQLMEALGGRATITKVKQEWDRIAVHVVSPSDFLAIAQILHSAAPGIAATTEHGLDIDLTTYWPGKKPVR